MSLLTMSAGLALLTAAPTTPSLSDDFRLHSGLPAGFVADGKLEEWKLPPSATLGAASQVAGTSKVASPDDFSAKVWAAMGPEGLAVAGEVRDERVLLAEKPGDLNSDHAEVWLALPQAKLPPLAFVNQFGEQPVPTPAACDDVPEEQEGCRKWWKAQTERRKKLLGAFTAQYGLLPAGVTRFGSKDAAGTTRYEPIAGGYRFEAFIPASAFPRSAQAPLRDVRLLVDVVDNDEGHAKQETFLSTSKRRRFGDASTFHAVTLAAPLRFGAWPELFEKVVAQEGVSYQPGPDGVALQAWRNTPLGYQYTPTEDSPGIVEFSLKPTPVAKLGDVEVVTVAAEPRGLSWVDRWLVSRRGPAVLDTKSIGAPELRAVARTPGLHILRVDERTMGYLGTGMCGACPLTELWLLKMTPDGRFLPAEELEGGGGDTGYTPAWKAAADLSSFEVYGDYGDSGDKPRKPFFSRYTWNAKKGAYEHLLQQEEAAEPAQAQDVP
jgi:hypothetical protein